MATNTSCESKRSSAYSEDLRWRIIWQSEALLYKPSVIAHNLNIDVSTVWRVMHIFRTTGDVAKKEYPVQRAFRVITEPVQLFIIHLILQRPGMFLREITSEVKSTLGLDVSESAVCKMLKKSGFTRQKLVTFALQRDDLLRNEFVTDVSLYEKSSLVFIDETGTDARDSIRTYGYSLRGKPLKAQKLFVRGEHISAIAAMSINGIIGLKIVQGGVNGDHFYDFVCTSLFPHLLPFNGTNENSIVIMDNCSIHHVPEVEQVISDAGSVSHYLPPYSPDFNPIELAFSKVKYMMRSLETEMQAIDDIETIVLYAFSTITVADCQAWISSIGIY